MSLVLTKRLLVLASDLKNAQVLVEKAEKQLKQYKEKVRSIEREVSDELEELGFLPGSKVETPHGTIKYGERVHANISKNNLQDAVSWLDEAGEGGMVKREVTVLFNRDQQEAVRQIVEELGEEYDVKEKQAIHHSTLSAWVRKRLDDGQPIPESISYYIQPVIEVKES